MVTLTDIAATKIKDYVEGQDKSIDDAGLRVGVKGGGCSGFTYSLAIDEQRDGDHIFENNGIKILVDDLSLRYVDESEVDFLDGLTGAGFQVNNPNVVAACGCGSSFRVKDEEDAEVDCPSGAAA
ncbi:MAG: iron-sulfur cluster assembly accessory protein [Thermoleophilaceae bacterium]|nr:iron-sulfur cluster assembly accessory protein [Thermoleophilaceae bacterium]